MTASVRWFEDFEVGTSFRSPTPSVVTAERIKAFAEEFDPQPSHVAESDARGAMFGELVASGWHIAAIAMRLIVDSDFGLRGQVAGVAIESMRWIKPVRPGDALRVEGSVIEARASRSHADRGVVKFRAITFNQRDEAVHEATHVVVAQRRSAARA